MTPQENQSLQDFLNQLTQVRGIAKDPQADTLIAAAAARQPDAAYLLVQRAMLLEQALNQSKAQIAQLQNELQQTRGQSTGFLDSANAWGNGANTAARPAQPAYQQNAVPVQPQMAAPARPGFFGGGGGSFLTNMAATAAGVAGGAFLFQGIENLMGHHHSASGLLDQPGMSGLSPDSMPATQHLVADTPDLDSTFGSDDLANLNLVDDSSSDDLSSI